MDFNSRGLNEEGVDETLKLIVVRVCKVQQNIEVHES